jgi:hypothetical protein
MKCGLMLDEKSRQMSTPSLSQELTLEDISPKWAMRLKNENIPTFMSPTWLQWRYQL